MVKKDNRIEQPILPSTLTFFYSATNSDSIPLRHNRLEIGSVGVYLLALLVLV